MAGGLHLVSDIVLILFNAVNILFHSMGIYLLKRLKRNGIEKIQNIYIMNLSIAELILNVVVLANRFTVLLQFRQNNSAIAEEVQSYLLTVAFTGIVLIYYSMIYYITLDKLVDILLNLKYPLYWNEKKATILLAMTWFLGVMASVSIVLARKFNGFLYDRAFILYVYPFLNGVFLILAVATYVFIFHKFKLTRAAPRGSTYANNNDFIQPTAFEVFRNSRFFVPSLLIVSFLIFVAIPSVVSFTYQLLNNHLSNRFFVSLWILNSISNVIDVFIYVFLTDDVRRLLRKMFQTREIR